jgi:hypothetical protein
MGASLQGEPRSCRRHATPLEKTRAEVMAACGCSFREISRSLGRSPGTARIWLLPAAAEAAREGIRRWREANSEILREKDRRYREANKEKVRAKNRRWDQANPDKKREKHRRWRQANLESIRERDRRRYHANREKFYANNCRWVQANREKVRERKLRWAQDNPEKRRESCRRWAQSNINKRREAHRRRDALRRASGSLALIPLTLDARQRRFALFGNRCAYCGAGARHCRNHGAERLSVEHVLALVAGGLDEPDNIVPACAACNSSKNTRPVDEWYCSQSFFTEPRWRKIQRLCPTATGQATLAIAAA